MQDFERAAKSGQRRGVIADFWQFLRHSKKWWLLPILVIMLGLGVLVLLSGTAVAPFIYTLF